MQSEHRVEARHTQEAAEGGKDRRPEHVAIFHQAGNAAFRFRMRFFEVSARLGVDAAYRPKALFRIQFHHREWIMSARLISRVLEYSSGISIAFKKIPETCRVKPKLMCNSSGIWGKRMIFISRPIPVRNQGRKPPHINPTQIRILQAGAAGFVGGWVTFLTRRGFSWAGDWAFSTSFGEGQFVKRLHLRMVVEA